MMAAGLPVAASNWLSGEDAERTGTPQMQWANLPESWGVFVLIAAIAAVSFAVFWLYRREQDTCPLTIKMLLAGLRLSVLLLLLALLLRPSMFYQQLNLIKPNVDLLRDASLSFARSDRYQREEDVQQLTAATGIDPERIAAGEVSRADLMNRAFGDRQWLTAVRESGTIRVIDFADGSKPVAVVPAVFQADEPLPADATDPLSDDAQTGPENQPANRLIRQSLPDLKPSGLGTDIWQALRESLDNASNLAAIVLVSDGQHNGSEDPLELAVRAGNLGIPIYVVGIGDPRPPLNVAVTEVFARNRGYPGEPFEVEALLQINAVEDANLPPQLTVELVQQRVDDRTGQLQDPQTVATQQVAAPPTGGRMRIDFQHTLQQPGRYVYTVAAETLDDEINIDDNRRRSAEVEIVDEKVRVLLIAGLPSWDYQQVQRLLQRDPSIALSCWLQSMDQSRPQEGDIPISRLPRSIEELGQYNVILMFDPDPREFDAAWIDTLRVFCRNKAGGLLYMAGPQFTGEFVTLNRLRGIRDILPVRLGDARYIDSSDALAFASSSTLADMLVVRSQLDHPVLSFQSDAELNEQLWASMPGIYWSFPALSAKPTARVLLERGDQVGAEGNIPLLVSGRYGAGSVLYLGFPGTWRWRPVGLQAQFFDRFWIQVIRFLVENRSLQGARRGFVDTDRTEYELGDRITLVGRILNEQFLPSTEETVTARITGQDGRIQNVEMQRLPGDNGQYEGSTTASRTGNYEATIVLADTDQDDLIEPISYRVVAPRVESSAFWLNEKLLQDIAQQSGGRYFRLNQVAELPEALPRRVQRVAFKSPPKPIWDWNALFRYTAFLLPVILLTTEWAVRKWYKLL